MLTGVFSTLLIPETKGKSLEDLSNEDQHGFITGVATRIEAVQDGVLLPEGGIGAKNRSKV